MEKKGNIKVQSLVDKPALGNFLTIQRLLLLLHLEACRSREVWNNSPYTGGAHHLENILGIRSTSLSHVYLLLLLLLLLEKGES